MVLGPESPEAASIIGEKVTSCHVKKTIVAQSSIGDCGFRLTTHWSGSIFRFLLISHYTLKKNPKNYVFILFQIINIYRSQ